jgi:hypothetical protein
MKLKEYLEELNKLVEEKPNLLNLEIVYSVDDEGNVYKRVYYSPTVGFYTPNDFIPENQFEVFEIEEGNVNAICIN